MHREVQALTAYAVALRRWPVPIVSHDIPPDFGSTYVIECGDAQAPNLVPLHPA